MNGTKSGYAENGKNKIRSTFRFNIGVNVSNLLVPQKTSRYAFTSIRTMHYNVCMTALNAIFPFIDLIDDIAPIQ